MHTSGINARLYFLRVRDYNLKFGSLPRYFAKLLTLTDISNSNLSLRSSNESEVKSFVKW